MSSRTPSDHGSDRTRRGGVAAGDPASAGRARARSGRFAPKTALGRAVYPVVGGIVFFGVLGLLLWGVAALLSNNPERVNENLAVIDFPVGNTESLANRIADDGPLLFQGLVGSDAKRSIVLDHVGTDPRREWTVYYNFPADRGPDCLSEQTPGTREFTDCDGRTIQVEDLTLPVGVNPIVGDTVTINLRGANLPQSETDPAAPVATDPTGTTTAPPTSE